MPVPLPSWLGGGEFQTPLDYLLMKSTGLVSTLLAELRFKLHPAPKPGLLPPHAGNQS